MLTLWFRSFGLHSLPMLRWIGRVGFSMSHFEGMKSVPPYTETNSARAGFWVVFLTAVWASHGQLSISPPFIDDIEHALPCADDLWDMESSDTWSSSRGAVLQGPPTATCASVVATLFRGAEPLSPISRYGMLSVAVGLLSHVLLFERVHSLVDNTTSHST